MRLPLLVSTIATAVLLLAGTTPARAAAAAAKPAELQWSAWDAGLSKAAAAGKPVLVDVYTDWCGWCRRMDHDVYSSAEIRSYLARKFVTVKLNAESPAPVTYQTQRYTGSSLAARFRVNGYPTTIFLRPNGDHLVNVPGYVPADRFLLLLQYVGDGHMDRGVSFDDFVQSQSPPAEAPGK